MNFFHNQGKNTHTGFLSCLETTQCSIIILLLGHSEDKPYSVHIFLYGHTLQNNTTPTSPQDYRVGQLQINWEIMKNIY